MVQNTEFTVLDLETTGLFPEKYDRIIELAAIRIDSKGKIIEEFETLINPNRDLGPTRIHGISAKELIYAPEFKNIAGNLLALLNGAVFVSHNVHFDMKFVKHEFSRMGIEVPPFPFLCTMMLMRRADPKLPSYRLVDICEYYGLPIERAHSAYSDAKAAADLLKISFSLLGGANSLKLSDLGVDDYESPAVAWPCLPKTEHAYKRDYAQLQKSPDSVFIDRLISRLPPMGDSCEIEEYVSLLDRVLEDRRITSDESEALFNMASEIGLSQWKVLEIHKKYLMDLIFIALEDEVITDAEAHDLESVRELLNISLDEYNEIYGRAEKISRERVRSFGDIECNVIQEMIGKTICFTGELIGKIGGQNIKREYAERIAKEKGLVVKDNVSRALNFLVVADPYTMSGKAQKAREYGTRIIAEAVFWKMMNVITD